MAGLFDVLEPAAAIRMPTSAAMQDVALLSMAISLRRIADEMSYSGNGGRSTDINAPVTVKDLLDIIAEAHA